MDAAIDTVSAVLQSPQKLVTYTWVVSLGLLFITFLVMCVAVSDMKNGHHDRVSAFAGAWTVLLFIIISALGTYFMSQFKSIYSIGVFAGVVFVMSNQMLIVFALFVERVKENDDDQAESSQSAMAVFCYFLFTAYAVFTALLVFLRERIGGDAYAEAEDEKVGREGAEDTESF